MRVRSWVSGAVALGVLSLPAVAGSVGAAPVVPAQAQAPLEGVSTGPGRPVDVSPELPEPVGTEVGGSAPVEVAEAEESFVASGGALSGAEFTAAPAGVEAESRAEERVATDGSVARGEGSSLEPAAEALLVPSVAAGSFASPSFHVLAPRSAPSARTESMSAYDAVRDEVVLFGGASSGLLGDTWVFDGVDWAQRSPALSPPARRDGEMVATDDGLILFGGRGPSGASLSDTWRWDGATWTQLSPTASPPGRLGFGMAWDSAASRVVLFGGETWSSYTTRTAVLGDTWTFDGTTWTQITGGPSARYDAELEFDPVRARTVLFGGLVPDGSSALGETWTLTGSMWTQQSPAGAPEARGAHAMAWDAALGMVVVYGGYGPGQVWGNLWGWDGSNWFRATSYLSAGPRSSVVLERSPANGNLVLFGGNTFDATYGDTQLFSWAGLGTQAGGTLDSLPVSDRSSVGVNVTSGNLLHASLDVSLAAPGGLGVVVERTYNNRHAGDSSLGSGWTTSVGADVAVSVLPNGSAVVFGLGGGDQAFFARNPSTGVFAAPQGWADWDLVRNGDGTWWLTERPSQHQYRFDTSGRLVAERDRSANQLTYAYAAGTDRLATITDPSGRVLSFSWNTGGRLSGISDAAGRSWSYGYDSDDRLSSYTDPTGAVTTYGYDDAWRLDRIEVDGVETRIYYDAAWRVENLHQDWDDSTTAWDRRSTYRYEPRLASASGTSPIGRSVAVNPAQQATSYDYDASFRVVRAVDNLGHEVATTFTPNGQIASTLDALGGQRAFTYTTGGRPASAVSPPSAPGQSPARSDISYATTGAGAGSSHLPSSVRDPQGNCVRSTYNANGLPAVVYRGITPSGGGGTNCNTQTSTFTVTTRYQGDPGISCGAKPGQVCQVVDSLATTSFAYDGAGNLASVTHPAPRGMESFTYDSVGRVATSTDGRGLVTRYTYDGNDRITRVRYDGTTTCASFTNCIEYYYTDAGLLEGYNDVTGFTSFSYNQNQQMTVKNVPGQANSGCVSGLSTTFRVDYDLAGQITQMCDAGGTVGYYYDAANRMIGLHEPDGGCEAPVSLCTTYAYDDADRRTQVNYPNGAGATMVYNGAGQVTSIVNRRQDGTTMRSFAYTYAEGTQDRVLRRSMLEEDGALSTYGYDTRNQLTSAVVSGVAPSSLRTDSFSWAYDGNGNRTQQVADGVTTNWAYNAANQLTTPGTVTPTFDGAGNMTRTAADVRMTYNPLGQTSSRANGAGASSAFQYAGADSTERTRIGTSRHVNSPLGLTSAGANRWVREPDGTLHSARSSSERMYYAFDAIGSVVGVTRSSGTEQRHHYEPFGRVWRSSGSSTLNPFRFVSGYEEAFGGQVKFGTRYYDTATGRWTQLDPSRQDPHHVYAGNDPINSIDPSGYEVTANGLIASCVAPGVGAGLTAAATPGGQLAVPAVAGIGCLTGVTVYTVYEGVTGLLESIRGETLYRQVTPIS